MHLITRPFLSIHFFSIIRLSQPFFPIHSFFSLPSFFINRGCRGPYLRLRGWHLFLFGTSIVLEVIQR